MGTIIEFRLPTEEFALEETLDTHPEAQIEIERVVADDPDRITPYIWVTRNRMVLYEAGQLPLPNPRELADEERERITAALHDLLDREAELDETGDSEGDVDLMAKKEEERDALDRAVLATIGMKDRVDELKQAVETLVELRRTGAGDQTTVLVNRTGEKEVIELEGVAEARESTRLSDF